MEGASSSSVHETYRAAEGATLSARERAGDHSTRKPKSMNCHTQTEVAFWAPPLPSDLLEQFDCGLLHLVGLLQGRHAGLPRYVVLRHQSCLLGDIRGSDS